MHQQAECIQASANNSGWRSRDDAVKTKVADSRVGSMKISNSSVQVCVYVCVCVEALVLLYYPSYSQYHTITITH